MGDSQARANLSNELIIIRKEQVSHLSLLEGIYCNPYCNRADTHWYTLDKAIPPDQRKPPKQVQFPDAPVRAGTYASKLVAGAGKRFESARRLFILFRFAGKRKPGRTRSSLSYSNRTATRAWLRTILRPQEYIAYSLSR